MRLAAAQLSIAERLDRVSLILEPGTITAICGPNGAGKSSLLEALAGLLPAGDGAVFLDRQQIAALPLRERARRIGYLPQAHEIAWDVPVRSLVELGRLPHGDRLAAPVDAALDAGLPVLVLSFHSPSLAPGNTPYTHSDADVDQLYDWLSGVYAHMAAHKVAPSRVADIWAAANHD